MADNPHAARLEAILSLLLGASTPEEMEAARKKAQKIAAMPDEQVQALAESAPGGAPQQPARYSRERPEEGESLAWFYADVLNALADAERDPDPAYLELIDEDADGSDWAVDRDELGRWHAAGREEAEEDGTDGLEETEDELSEEAAEDTGEDEPEEDGETVVVAVPFHRTVGALFYASARSPKGGMYVGRKWYKGGRFIPAHRIARATPAQRAQLADAEKEAQARADERRRMRPAIAAQAGGGEVGPGDARFLAGVLATLQSLHGEETPARLHEIALPLKTALAESRVDAREALQEQLARVGWMARRCRKG